MNYTYSDIESILISNNDVLCMELDNIVSSLPKQDDKIIIDEKQVGHVVNLSNRIRAIDNLYGILEKYCNTTDILEELQYIYYDICNKLKSEFVINKELINEVYKELTRTILLLDISLLVGYDMLIKVHTLNKK